MADAPVQVILAAFKERHGADKALQQLRGAAREHLIDIRNVAYSAVITDDSAVIARANSYAPSPTAPLSTESSVQPTSQPNTNLRVAEPSPNVN